MPKGVSIKYKNTLNLSISSRLLDTTAVLRKKQKENLIEILSPLSLFLRQKTKTTISLSII